MAINLNYVFTCIGPRPGHETDQNLVQGHAISVYDPAVGKPVWLKLLMFTLKHFLYYPKALGPAQPDNAHCSHAHGSGDGCYGILKIAHLLIKRRGGKMFFSPPLQVFYSCDGFFRRCLGMMSTLFMGPSPLLLVLIFLSFCRAMWTILR